MGTRLNPDSMPAWLSDVFPSYERASILAGVDDDDCAVVRLGGKYLVLTMDYLNARPIALELGIGNHRTLGRLVVGASLSDLCGSGALPEYLLAGITMHRKARTKDFQELMLGIRQETRRWNVSVVGGDTKLGDATAIATVAIGCAGSRGSLFLKNSAKAGDLLWCSGFLGSCNAAVLGFRARGLKASWKRWAVRAITVPQIPLKKSQALAASKLGRGGIDISDGLGADLKRLCVGSNVGAVVEAKKIPIARNARLVARILKVPAWTLAFGAGGDFQFLVTTSPNARDRVSRLGFRLIGKITARKHLALRCPQSKEMPLPTAGHLDYRNKQFSDEILTLVKEAADVQT